MFTNCRFITANNLTRRHGRYVSVTAATATEEQLGLK